MTLTTILVTFGASAVQPVTTSTTATRVRFEPNSSNVARCSVGGPNVTIDGSGVGVIRSLAAGGVAASVILDYFELADEGGDNRVYVDTFWCHGATGEKLKLSYWVE